MIASRALLASALTYIVVTGWIGRDILGSLGTIIANDPGDPILNAAILAWNAAHMPWTEAWFQFPIFFPTPNALALSEHLLGISVIATPIYWITGNALTAYNLTLLLTYPLAGVTMFLLVRRLTGSSAAAFLSGLAFAFAPYRASQLPHIQMLATFWAPLALLGLHRFVDAAGVVRLKPDTTYDGVQLQPDTDDSVQGRTAPRWRWLVLFALCWMLQGAANSYFLVFFTVLIGLWVLWFVVARERWRDAASIAAAAAVAMVPLAPILFTYLSSLHELGLSRNLGEIAVFSADVAAPLCAPPSLVFWGWLRAACRPEGELFPGVALLVLCGMGAWLGRASRAGGSRGASGAGGAGEAGKGGGAGASGAGGAGRGGDNRLRRVVRRLAIGGALVYMLIAVSVLALGPWRFDLGWMRASASSADKPMSVAVVLLLVAVLLTPRLWRVVRRGSTATFYLAAAFVCWVFSWGPFPRLFDTDVLYQAPYAWLLQLPAVANVRVPARFWMMTVLCLTIVLGFAVARLLSRCSRRAAAAIVTVAACGLVADGLTTIRAAVVPAGIPDAARAHEAPVLALPLGDIQRDVGSVYHAVIGGWRSVNGFSGYAPPHYEALTTLSRARDQALFQPFRERGDLTVVVDERDDATRALVEGQPGIQLTGASGGRRQYLLARMAVNRPALELGQRIGVVSLAASCSPEGLVYATDDDLDTRWVCGTQVADEWMTIDLGQVTMVGAVIHALGSLGADFPRELVLETSIDAATWQSAWQGSPAPAVLSAALESPRLTRAVLPFAPRDARYVRLRQIGRDDRNYWSMAEVEVWTISRSGT